MRLDDRLEIRLRRVDRIEIEAAAAVRGWTLSLYIREAALSAARAQAAAQGNRRRGAAPQSAGG